MSEIGARVNISMILALASISSH